MVRIPRNSIVYSHRSFKVLPLYIKKNDVKYSWVLNCVKSILDKCMHPCVIIKDRELTLINACETVFPDAAQYIDDTWLNKYKEMFVSVWVDQHLNFGNRTTNRAEIQYSNLTVRYDHHNLSCFQLLWGHVSNEALDIILGEIQSLGDLMLDSSNCGCKLRNSCGLLSACMLSFYSISVRKLEEVYDLHKSDVGEPTVQKNMCGRPSVKKQQKKKVNPPNHVPRRCSFSTTSEFNVVGLNKEPERHSFSCGIDLNDEPQ
uniref:Protein FAR1-RELATED SEQUENCE n=1 Tax=Lactuca sativa TaxID=4236 RepID=A0A9R1UQI2_LACSA|nr:hypothetical protein LSAT_V11C800416290 [Lactuca sativa]